jgi:hypothetical protein
MFPTVICMRSAQPNDIKPVDDHEHRVCNGWLRLAPPVNPKPVYLYLFRPNSKSEKVDGRVAAAPHDDTSAETREAIVCRQCLHGITASAERTLVNGAHTHTFANPEGIVFEIGCYRDAWGCGYLGPIA